MTRRERGGGERTEGGDGKRKEDKWFIAERVWRVRNKGESVRA